MKISQVINDKFICAVTTEKFIHPITGQATDVQVQDHKNLNSTDRWNNYVSVGHDPKDKAIVWAYIGGQIQTNRTDSENPNHVYFWEQEVLEQTFYGRVVTDGSGITATMNRPVNGANSETEAKVKRLLFTQFNPTVIKVFG